VRTRTGPSDSGGSGISSSLAEWAMPGETVIARILLLDWLELESRRALSAIKHSALARNAVVGLSGKRH